MVFHGIIIEESLEDKSILKDLKILKTKVEKVTSEHRTPWLSKWTIHTIEIGDKSAMKIAGKISAALSKKHPWYCDYKDDEYHFIIFSKHLFCVKKENTYEYEDVKKYGRKLGIPEHQLDFDK